MPTFMIADTTESERQAELVDIGMQRSLHDEERSELRSITKARVQQIAHEIRRILGENAHLNILENIGTVLADLTEAQANMVKTQLPHLTIANDSPLMPPKVIIETPPDAR